jgi:hypothetical protein
VEDGQSAVLHTGDFRAEPWFLDNIRRNPFLQPYLSPPKVHEGAIPGQLDEKRLGAPLFKTLDAIYLDTACLFSTIEVPTKVPPHLLSVHARGILIVGPHFRVMRPRAWYL